MKKTGAGDNSAFDGRVGLVLSGVLESSPLAVLGVGTGVEGNYGPGDDLLILDSC